MKSRLVLCVVLTAGFALLSIPVSLPAYSRFSDQTLYDSNTSPAWERALNMSAGEGTSTYENLPTSAMTETRCSGKVLTEDSDADHLIGATLVGLRGYCVENGGKLTGGCTTGIHVGPGCIVAEHACPSGQRAKQPGRYECCGLINCTTLTVDLATRCKE